MVFAYSWFYMRRKAVLERNVPEVGVSVGKCEDGVSEEQQFLTKKEGSTIVYKGGWHS